MSQPDAPSAPTYSFAGVQLKPSRRLLLRDGQPLSLGSRAFDVLVALVQRSPELVTKESLMNAAWPGLVVEEANLHVQVSSLRRLLGPGDAPKPKHWIGVTAPPWPSSALALSTGQQMSRDHPLHHLQHRRHELGRRSQQLVLATQAASQPKEPAGQDVALNVMRVMASPGGRVAPPHGRRPGWTVSHRAVARPQLI